MVIKQKPIVKKTWRFLSKSTTGFILPETKNKWPVFGKKRVKNHNQVTVGHGKQPIMRTSCGAPQNASVLSWGRGLAIETSNPGHK